MYAGGRSLRVWSWGLKRAPARSKRSFAVPWPVHSTHPPTHLVYLFCYSTDRQHDFCGLQRQGRLRVLLLQHRPVSGSGLAPARLPACRPACLRWGGSVLPRSFATA